MKPRGGRARIKRHEPRAVELVVEQRSDRACGTGIMAARAPNPVANIMRRRSISGTSKGRYQPVLRPTQEDDVTADDGRLGARSARISEVAGRRCARSFTAPPFDGRDVVPGGERGNRAAPGGIPDRCRA